MSGCGTCKKKECCCDSGSAISTRGKRGLAGSKGVDGIFGGYSSAWMFDTDIVLNNPSAKFLSLDAANPAAATEIYINTTNYINKPIPDFLDSLNNGGDFGWIRLFDRKDSSLFHYYQITGVSVLGSVYTLAVTYVDGSGSTAFTKNNDVVLSFTPTVAGGGVTTIGNTTVAENDGSILQGIGPGGIPSTVLNNCTATAPVTGIYNIFGNLEIRTPSASPGAVYQFWFLKNGVTVLTGGVRRFNGTITYSQNHLMGFNIPLNATDTVSLVLSTTLIDPGDTVTVAYRSVALIQTA